MSVKQKQVDYCSEVDTLFAVFTGLVGDVVAKKPAAQVVSDAVPNLVAALTGLADLGVEVANGKAFDNTIALKLVELKQAFLPGVV